MLKWTTIYEPESLAGYVWGVYIEKHWSEHRSQTINQEMAFALKSWLQNKILPFIAIPLRLQLEKKKWRFVNIH